MQLDLFSTGIKCSHCNEDPGRSEKNSCLWYGFFDMDTQQHVCRDCYSIHYRLKGSTDKKGLYSEFPVQVK